MKHLIITVTLILLAVGTAWGETKRIWVATCTTQTVCPYDLPGETIFMGLEPDRENEIQKWLEAHVGWDLVTWGRIGDSFNQGKWAWYLYEKSEKSLYCQELRERIEAIEKTYALPVDISGSTQQPRLDRLEERIRELEKEWEGYLKWKFTIETEP